MSEIAVSHSHAAMLRVWEVGKRWKTLEDVKLFFVAVWTLLCKVDGDMGRRICT